MEGKILHGRIEVIVGPMFAGKCLGENTPILMHDGTTKMVQNVKFGDALVGDDYDARIVISVTRGMGQLYRIHQSNTSFYVVNEDHVLTLWDDRIDRLIDIPLMEYMKTKPREHLLGVKIVARDEYRFSVINVEKIEFGQFYGFTLSGNGRFLLGDTTVTHNTTEMIRRINRWSCGGKKCLIIKPKRDVRYDAKKCCTHDGMMADAEITDDLFNVDCSEYDVIGIDEGQFFDNIVEFAKKQASLGKIVIVASLDGTSEAKPFGRVHELLPFSDYFKKFSAMCKCGNTAPFTICLREKVSDVMIGGKDLYRAVCRTCRDKYLAQGAIHDQQS